MTFFSGQKVVCIKKGNWITRSGSMPKSAPAKGEVCTVVKVASSPRIRVGLFLKEHGPGMFNSRCFRPTVHPKVEELKKFFTNPKLKIKETSL